jgi:hypothetical protein
MASREDEDDFGWRGVGTASGALIAALVLVGVVFFLAMSSRARDDAVASERHTYDVTLLTRTLDASIARAEADDDANHGQEIGQALGLGREHRALRHLLFERLALAVGDFRQFGAQILAGIRACCAVEITGAASLGDRRPGDQSKLVAAPPV